MGAPDPPFRDREDAPGALRLARMACGTRFELVLVRESGAGALAERDLRAAGEAALREVEEVDARYSLFRPDSLLARIHAHAARGPVALDGDAYELFAEALAIWRASGGAFDPALAPRQAARGLHPGSPVSPDARAPGAEAILLCDDPWRIAFTSAGVALDLGAIAKGHALDRAARVLRDAGVERALLHGGTSSVLALGAPPGMRGWSVALEGVNGPRVLLCDRALALSAPHGRRDDAGAGHVLDPRNGKAVPDERAALVLAPSARAADAWSTALLVDPALAAPPALTFALGRGPRGLRHWTWSGAPAPLFASPRPTACPPTAATSSFTPPEPWAPSPSRPKRSPPAPAAAARRSASA